MSEHALVYGLGISGEAVARHLRDRGARVTAVDDRPTEEVRARAADAGLEFVGRPDPLTLRELVASADVVVPTPGVPEAHAVIRLAEELGVRVRSEVELAYRWARRPMVAITGTNGKTTVTELVTAMLVASGKRAIAAGNIGAPLSDAVRRDVDVVVAEVSSFQLRFTDTFHPSVAVWLNFAADHLDWHPDLASYAAAKARIWAHQGGHDTAVVNADDRVVMEAVASAPSKVVTFGLSASAGSGGEASAEADWHIANDELRGPSGPIMPVAELPRRHRHDVTNALAAAAAATAAGATPDGVAEAIRAQPERPHRVSLVIEANGVRWYDDSKATNPHATLAALNGFESVVLIAGGLNKGLDLGDLSGGAGRVRAVVAIGDAAAEVEAAFKDIRPVAVAGSMTQAVIEAATLAEPGDAVLLSPAAASFDWYRSYAERGDDFAEAVRRYVEEQSRGL